MKMETHKNKNLRMPFIWTWQGPLGTSLPVKTKSLAIRLLPSQILEARTAGEPASASGVLLGENPRNGFEQAPIFPLVQRRQ
jgi:hypothetical protein